MNQDKNLEMSEERYEEYRKEYKKKSRARNVLLVLLICFELILVLGVGIVYGIFKSKYDKSIFRDKESLNYNATIETGTLPDSPKAVVDKIHDEMKDVAKRQIRDDKEVTNILLIGSDRRQLDWDGNSDAIIICSINRRTRRIVMTSIMRDTYAYIEPKASWHGGYWRINHANALAGPTFLVKTIENNFKIDIDYYASVDFYAFADIVNIMGGLDLDILPQEIPYINTGIAEYNRLVGLPSEDGFLHQSGTVHVTGKQALSYARIRKLDSDYNRTARQRTVLMKIFHKAAGLSVGQLNSLMDAILPHVIHNIPQGEMISLLLEVPKFLKYTVISDQLIPYKDNRKVLTVKGQWVISPVDWESTINRLHHEVYD